MDRNQQDSHVFRPTAATISEQIAESSAQWQQLPVTKSGDKPEVPRDRPHQEPWDSHCPWGSCKANHRERKTATTNCRNAHFTGVQLLRTVQKRTPGPACANSRNTAVLSCKDKRSLSAESIQRAGARAPGLHPPGLHSGPEQRGFGGREATSAHISQAQDCTLGCVRRAAPGGPLLQIGPPEQRQSTGTHFPSGGREE